VEVKKQTPKAKRRSAFTLIELLVVITIITILIGLLFPAFRGVQDQAKRTQAKNDVTQIVTAVNAFYTEYGRYPVGTTVTTDAAAWYGPGGAITENGGLFAVLRGTESPIVLNTRQIVFISPPDAKDQTTSRSGIKTTTSGYYDPWGTEYAIKIDADYTNQIEANPYSDLTSPIRTGVIAWSLGKDQILGDKTKADGKFTGSDDVISWQ
jgi:prepilin-type N-terminal cleavage/methylation domain-containing protein